MKSTKENVLEWAEQRNLLNEENHTKQLIKLMEEVGELSKAILEKNPYDTIDAIGDIRVVITILAKQLNLDDDDCFQSAYEVIKDRQGKLVDGTFIRFK